MPVGGEVLIAGPSQVSLGGASMGLFQGDDGVPSLNRTAMAIPIDSTHLYGRQIIDEIEMGDTYAFEAVCLEYSKAKTTFLSLMATWGRQPVIGRLKYSIAASLVLTAVSGVSAATVPASVTASKAVAARDFQVRIFFGPQLRTVAIRLQLLPYDIGGGVVGNFTET